MTFNEFQRELKKHCPDERMAYLFTLLFEMCMGLSKDADTQVRLLLSLADQQQRFVALSDEAQKRIKQLERRGRGEGIEVNSVMPTPDV